MIYLALLRGINVGGKSRVEMPRLKATFEHLGYSDVSTYINSGNVIFHTNSAVPDLLAGDIERAISQEFGTNTAVVVRDAPNIAALVAAVPPTWVNDVSQKTDVLFLMPAIEHSSITNHFTIKPDIERLIVAPGALIWNIDRRHLSHGSMIKIVGTDTYRNLTIRNINTVRKLAALLSANSRPNV